MYEESLKVLDEGQVLTGVIVAKYQDELLVDIGGKSEGILSFRELSLAIEPKELRVGDKLEVMIHRIDDQTEHGIHKRDRDECIESVLGNVDSASEECWIRQHQPAGPKRRCEVIVKAQDRHFRTPLKVRVPLLADRHQFASSQGSGALTMTRVFQVLHAP